MEYGPNLPGDKLQCGELSTIYRPDQVRVQAGATQRTTMKAQRFTELGMICTKESQHADI